MDGVYHVFRVRCVFCGMRETLVIPTCQPDESREHWMARAVQNVRDAHAKISPNCATVATPIMKGDA